MISKVALVLVLLTIITLLLLELVVFRGVFREELLPSFPSRTCLHLTIYRSFAMDVLLLFQLFEESVEGQLT